jgi:predicted dehydrogenase
MKDRTRRELLGASAGGLMLGAVGGLGLLQASPGRARELAPLRWGVVGTGGIANAMARMIKLADKANLAAVSSRRMETAREFADSHGVPHSFDSWAELARSDMVDAIYVATPTSVREQICLAAAAAGKHVLGEKPFASLASVQRITAACRENNLVFMDGTHFVHHPRTLALKAEQAALTGVPWSVASAFQFNLPDRDNIRFNTKLEPMGAIGDAGWYNMRAAVEFLPSDVVLAEARAFLRRDRQTGAAIGGSGVLQFTNGAASTWNCGFDSGAVVMDLRITGPDGVINIDDFLSQNRDHSADYLLRRGGWSNGESGDIKVPSEKPGAALMFEDFAAAVANPALREPWMSASERTQALLDAAWQSALASEQG